MNVDLLRVLLHNLATTHTRQLPLPQPAFNEWKALLSPTSTIQQVIKLSSIREKNDSFY